MQIPELPSIRRCPACGDRTTHHERYKKRGFAIVACEKCGLGCTVVPPDFDPTAIYNEDYFKGGVYSDYAGSEPVLRRQFRRTVEHLRKLVPRGARLVEWGAAYGFFLLEAQSHFECTGIEIADGAREKARERGMTMFHPGDPAWRRRAPFDAAVLLDCIEHLAEPEQVLADVAASVRPGGVLLMTTGNWASLYSQVSGPRWRLMTPPEHLYFYTPHSMARLLERHGFQVTEVRHPWKIVPLGFMAHQLRSWTGMPLPALPDNVGVPVNLFDAMRVVARRI